MTIVGPGISPVDLNESELLSAAVTGMPKDLSADNAELNDPAKGADWGAERQIRAGFLIDLLTGASSSDSKCPRAVKLRGARVTGSLDLEALTLVCPLELENCHIDQAVNLNEVTAPKIRMTGCHLSNLAATQLRTVGDLILNAGFTATEGVYLLGARIGGLLDLTDATLANPYGAALSADGLTVEQSMYCRKKFTSTGEVRLPGARVCGQLDFTGATLVAAASPSNPEGTRALAADGIVVDHDMICEFKVTGEVRLLGAHIGGDLNFTGATLANLGGPALAADGLTVEHNLFGRGHFRVTGEVRLVDAHVRGQLDFSGATLCGPSGTTAMAADGLTVDHDMSCGFAAVGEVRLLGAHIGGHLDFTGANLVNLGGTTLDLDGATATALLLLPMHQPQGPVDLTNAKVSIFSDDPKSWPAVVHLRGFTYDSFGNGGVSVRGRLRWLTRNAGGFAPQLYDQLAAVYRRAGDEPAARKVAVVKQWRRRSAFNPLSWLWYVTVGYGYRTWLAGVWLAVLVALGTWVFSRAYPAHMIAITSRPPAFHAVAYAFDLLLPVVSLGQKTAWQPEGSALLYWSWALTIAGWVLTTAVVSGLTGILKRD